jgi:aerobic-type carbon monoxide dehydrogenase small subunit (CoxS/CutS family)
VKLRLAVNGAPLEVEIEPDALLLDVLREHGRLDVKEGCGVGVCGACTVLVGDLPVSSCLYLAACTEGREVWTASGVAERQPSLRDAFLEAEAFQCGICTPGQLVAAAALLRQEPDPDEQQIRRYLAGNLCRCTGYASIVDAIRMSLARV